MFTLGEKGLKIKYSKTEREIFALLPPSGTKRSSTDITRLRYMGKPPYYAQSSVNSALRSLREKIAVNREPFRLEKSDRAGPHPILFWIEKRK